MDTFEYKVIAAPTKGRKAKGVKTADGRFALALEDVLNAMAAEGWSYVRAETLPSEERQGLTGSATGFRNVLIFRRDRAVDDIDESEDRFSRRLYDIAEFEDPAAPEPAPATVSDDIDDQDDDRTIVTRLETPDEDRRP